MFSSTSKRSFTTLAVIAGLLVAVAPAGAHGAGSATKKIACDGIGAVTCTSLNPDKNELAIEGRTAKGRGWQRTHLNARSGAIVVADHTY